MRLRLPLVALAAALVASPLPAAAESWSAGEPRRDVTTWTYEDEPGPCGTVTEAVDPADTSTDIVRLAVRHSRTVVRVVVAFRDLEATSQHSTQLFLRTSAGDYQVDVDRTGPWRKPLSDLIEMPDYDALQGEADECGAFGFISSPEDCRLAVDLDPQEDRLVVRVPRACLGDPRWVRAGASATTWLGEGTEIAASRDRWQPPGVRSPTRIDGPYGPRVRVG